MTKTEIIQNLASECEVTQKQATQFLDAFCNLVGDTLKNQDTVAIMGFAKFTASLVKGRVGKNPQNPSEKLTIPDSYRIYFSAGQALKDKVNSTLKKKGGAKKSTSKKAKASKSKAKKKK